MHKRGRKSISAVLVLGGLLLIFCHHTYIIRFSGSEFGTYPITRGVTAVSLRTDSRGHIYWARVGPLALSRAMNPFRVRAKLAVEYDSPAPPGPFFRDVWQLLDEKGHELSRLSGHYTSVNPLNTASMTVGGTFRVQEDGRYFLKAKLDPEERVIVRSLSLEVRQNTGEISVGVLLFGGLFVLSGVVLGYAAWREPLAVLIPWRRD